MTTTTPADRARLARALAIAHTAAGRTAPNPNVGCVLVRDGRVVGEGATEPPGGPHAEVVALAAAGEQALGASAYVTLEPCAHHGRTAPCTEALMAAGVARVVVVHEDPHELARGGVERLRAAGVEVVGPLPPGDPLHQAVAEQLEGFLQVVHHGRPHVTLKLAQAADGSLVAPGTRRYLTDRAARRAVHRWRASVDAVLVGSGTVLADDPLLDVRGIVADNAPRPVVLDRRLRVEPTARVVGRGALIVTRAQTPVDRRKALLDAGAEVVDLPTHAAPRDELRAALELVASHGITSILAEPGATLAAAFIGAQLVDRLVLHIALGVGDGAPRRAVGPPPGARWVTRRSGGAGPDLIWHLVPVPTPHTASPGGT